MAPALALRSLGNFRCRSAGFGLAAAVGVVILQTAVITAKLLLQIVGRLIGTEIGVSGHRIGAKHGSGIEMQNAFSVEPEALFADGDVAGEPAAFEILRRCLWTRALMRSRKASPTSMFLPETRKDMGSSGSTNALNERGVPFEL
jgi:hypothetical protein